MYFWLDVCQLEAIVSEFEAVYTSTAVPVFQLERFRVSSWQFVRPWTQTGRKHETNMQRRHLFADLTIPVHHLMSPHSVRSVSPSKNYISPPPRAVMLFSQLHILTYWLCHKGTSFPLPPIFPGIPLLLPLIPFSSTFPLFLGYRFPENMN